MAEAQELVVRCDLQGLQKSVNNAYSLYVKTRPPASAESAARVKSLAKEGLHPLLAKALPRASVAGLEAQVRTSYAISAGQNTPGHLLDHFGDDNGPPNSVLTGSC